MKKLDFSRKGLITRNSDKRKSMWRPVDLAHERKT